MFSHSFATCVLIGAGFGLAIAAVQAAWLVATDPMFRHGLKCCVPSRRRRPR